MERMPSEKEWEAVEEMAAYALKRLQECEYVLCIYPQKLASSVLVELGYAIALRRKCIVVTKNRKDLPYILKEADRRVNYFKVYELDGTTSFSSFIEKRLAGMFDFSTF